MKNHTFVARITVIVAIKSFRSPSRSTWEREREDSNDRDSHTPRNHKSNRSSVYSARDNDESRSRDDSNKRYSGNRRHRNAIENEERWRSDSPISMRNSVNRKDNLREVRQVCVKKLKRITK